MNSPFVKAAKAEKKVKLLIWGASGAGKTTLALQFPRPVVFDLDHGSDLYGDKFDFDVIQTTEIAAFKHAIKWLIDNPGHYETVVVDPISVYWESLQKYWGEVFCQRLKGYKGNKNEFFELGPKEWSTIKLDFKNTVNKILSLDLNVVMTAREADNYKEGGFMVKDGVRIDCERRISYAFDVVVRLYREGKNFWGEISKDRTESLPLEPFDINIVNIFEKLAITAITKGKEDATIQLEQHSRQ